jgi:hypothetical protein
MKTYRVNERGLVHAPEAVVKVNWGGAIGTVELRVDEIDAFVKKEWLFRRNPFNTTTTDGRKAWINPCIIAKTPEAACAISAIVGYPVMQGDGVSAATKAMAHDWWQALMELNVSEDQLVKEWRMGAIPESQLQLPLQPKEKFSQAERDAAMADAPF